MKSLLFALALVFAAVPRAGAEFTGTFGMATEIDRLAALLGDEILRDMVCRLSSERYTPASLGAATGLPEGQVLRRLNRLRGWGLVRMVRRDSARTIVEPMPGEGARTLRRWAERYCPTGDGCGRPAGKDGRGRRAGDTGGAASTGEAGDTGETSESLRGKLVTIFGGAGFLGQDLAKYLISAGAKVRVASRNPDAVFLPNEVVEDKRLTTMVADGREPMDIDAAMAGAAMVVNLISTPPGTEILEQIDINEIVAHRIALAAAEKMVERLVHVSTISANPESRSLFARTKAEGEKAAQRKFADVTIVRPTLVLGHGGGFLKRAVDLSRLTPVLPLIREGKPLLQPVYVGDVSKAIVRILTDPSTKGRAYELGGPRKLTMHEIVALATQESEDLHPDEELPEHVAKAREGLLQSLPRALREKGETASGGRDFVVAPKALGLADLGIKATPIEDVVEAYRPHPRW